MDKCSYLVYIIFISNGFSQFKVLKYTDSHDTLNTHTHTHLQNSYSTLLYSPNLNPNTGHNMPNLNPSP